ncbi:MAG: tetratricopeptide repeat protein, partial [Proteobacteria bacterium]|nr:tetratricopeptide repeat protein [Pseudomonadota bacterium]
MKVSSLSLAIVIMVILFLSGCAPDRKKTLRLDERQAGTALDGVEPESSYYYFTEAQLHWNKGDSDKAIQYLNKAIQQDPESLYLQLELAILYLQQKDNTRALNIVEKVIEKDPENIKALIIYGKLKQEAKMFEASEKAYEKIINIDPKEKNIYLLLGGLYMQEDKLDSALKTFQKLVHNFPESYAGHFFIGKIYVAQDNLAGAETEFKKTLELNSDLEEPRYELLNLYKTLGKEKEIVRLYNDLLEKDPENIIAAMELGYFYYQKGKKKDAEKIF